MNNALMAPRKNKRNDASRAIAQAIIDNFKPETAEDMQNALRDIFGPMFEAMLQGKIFDPQLIPKRSKDVSGIEDKVLSMYAKGMS